MVMVKWLVDCHNFEYVGSFTVHELYLIFNDQRPLIKPGKPTQLVIDAEMSPLNAQFAIHCCKKLY